MLFGAPLGELAWLAAAIMVGGLFSGLLAGAFGVGGGAIIVPILYEVFRALHVPEEIRMQLCVGTSLAIIAPTSIRAFFAHRAKSELPTGILRIWALPIVIGVSSGGAVAAFAPSWIFKLAFVVIAALLAIRLLFGSNWRKLGSELPGRALMILYGLIIGLYSALMGVGGGSVSTMILTLYGTAIHKAVGISAGVGVFVSLAGAASFMLAGLRYQALTPPLSIGFVSLIGFVLMAPVTSFVAPFGARLAHFLSKRQLEIAFGLFLVIVSVRFLASLIG